MVKKQKDDLARRRLSTRARPGRSRGALGLIAACMQLLEEALGMGHYGERCAAGCSPCRETPCASNLRLRYSVAAAAPRNYMASKNSPKNSPSFSRFRQPWPSRIVCSSPSVTHATASAFFCGVSQLDGWGLSTWPPSRRSSSSLKKPSSVVLCVRVFGGLCDGRLNTRKNRLKTQEAMRHSSIRSER